MHVCAVQVSLSEENTMILMKSTFQAAGFVAAFALSGVVLAGEALSWNLSRDMMTGITQNPKGVWAFMQNNTHTHDPANYTLLPSYWGPIGPYGYPISMWRNDENEAYIGIPTKTHRWGGASITALRGMPHLHPGFNGNQPILRWKSPVSGTINILGRVSSVDGTCGDGITWSLENGATVLQSGILKGNGTVFSAQDLPVSKGTRLYFIIGMGADYFCDTTNLDMIIVSQQ